MKIDYLQALKRIENAQGAWVLQGQEPLLEHNLLDQLRQHWQRQGIERQRYEIQSVSDWKTVFNALNSLSLFSQQLAIEAHGKIKPDAASLKLLKNYLQHNEQNLLVVVMPKQDNQSLKSAFFQLIEANAVLVSLNAPYPQDRQRILTVEAEKLGISLDSAAWQWLLEHHEHNLLAAKNSLIRVSDTFAEHSQIHVEDLQSCLNDQSRYSLYDLSDNLLKGDLATAIKIYQYLLATGEAMSLILWTLSKEMRLLMLLFEQPQNALQLGIWKTKVHLYQQALRRIAPQQLLGWPNLLLKLDASIKGLSADNAEQLALQAVVEICQQPLFQK
ncbi:DNA polymerase III subunit delta [Acinetobacter sp. MD2(2019)]|uniref:DNA polymerase III subunit delta n=1 Tax=Acinetobacter sp. MD2(2019) TaxID=2605273 RepID=UPI002D1F6C8A|nr:DNA polymerase III subunit delta [Acinetobacter sp. MD2(2019)]MEB3753579.1 DNA polymerase III subunit delta [Acinetobacter sp. MD2(2019)]